MKRPNPEKKVVCNDCIFCSGLSPVCSAVPAKKPISQRELFTRPDWCPFHPAPKLF